MNAIEKRIIEMVNQGHSYTEIQAELGVSPSKISTTKKEYKHLLRSSGSGENSTTTATQKVPSEMLGADFDHHPHNSSMDSETLLRLKEIELEHQRELKQMEYDEKEREREFEKERKERELEATRLSNETLIENQELRDQLESLQDEIEDLHDEMHSLNEVEEEPDFIYDFKDFISDMLSWDGQYWKDDEIDEQIDRCVRIKQEIEDWFEESENDVEDNNYWKIVNEAFEDFQDLKERLSNKIFSSSIHYEFSEEWRERLEEHA